MVANVTDERLRAQQQMEALKQEKEQLRGEMEELKGAAKKPWVFDKKLAYVSYDAGNSSLGGWLHAQHADHLNASSPPGSAHANSSGMRLGTNGQARAWAKKAISWMVPSKKPANDTRANASSWLWWWRNAQEVNASSGSSAGSSNASSFNSSIAPTPTPGSQGLQGVGASPVGPAPLPHNDTVARVLHHNDAHGRRSSGKQSRMSKMDMSKPRKVLEQELLRTMHAPIHSLYGDHPSVAVEWSGIVGTPSPPPPDSAAGDGLREWSERLLRKRDACLRTQKTGVFWHYHSRKCGGTSLRHLLEQSAKFYKAPYWESEGRSVMGELLEMPGVLSAISLRHPIERIVSLYWYEHVGWWHSIKKDKSQLRNFTDWVDEWRDESAWKTRFMHLFPKAVYVEVENYFVKALIGWTGPGKVGEADLEAAKLRLASFDFVLVSELMSEQGTDDLIRLSVLLCVAAYLTRTLMAESDSPRTCAGHQLPTEEWPAQLDRT
eukprot:Tamp_06253.p1 GENE.Tamp_06253~~Tamp_06253.p1  ORF type:complete len:492 (+),score=90.38 Tamp_06253:373-1848(+)